MTLNVDFPRFEGLLFVTGVKTQNADRGHTHHNHLNQSNYFLLNYMKYRSILICCVFFVPSIIYSNPNIYRLTDIYFIDIKKTHYGLKCHRNERQFICTFNIVNLLKSYDNVHGMTYRIRITLSGIAIINAGYFDNTNDYYIK